MLIQDILKASLHQWRFTCMVCGVEKARTGPNQKVCAGCAQVRDKSYHRARYGRNIGDTISCSKCSCDFILDHPSRSICNGCKITTRTVPSCNGCGVAIERTSNRQIYCIECKSKRKKALKKAEYDRERKNPKSMARRTKYATSYSSRRYRTDYRYNINVRMRTAVAQSLATGKSGRRWQSLVGFSAPELIEHLERQFLPGMSWDNRALWHVDHIVPLASFTFTTADDPEFRAAWALTNLRPLWKADNLAKSDQRLFLI